jgi:hypothetical protein
MTATGTWLERQELTVAINVVQLKLSPQLVGQRDPRHDQILPRPCQRPQRLGLIAVRLKQAEPTKQHPRGRSVT